MTLSARLSAQGTPPQGSWETAYNHPAIPTTGHVWSGFRPPAGNATYNGSAVFNASHVALIPKGPDRGRVLAWDWQHYAAVPGTFQQRWTILDPKTMLFQDSLLVMPSTRRGDPFCAGHAWDANGDLVIAGGNEYKLINNSVVLHGHKLVWVYKPNNTGTLPKWDQSPKDMAAARWYPSVTLVGSANTSRMLIAGGTANGTSGTNGTTDYCYELYDSKFNVYDANPNGARYGSTKLFYGPGIVYSGDKPSPFSTYARVHLLPWGSGSTTTWGNVFHSGHGEDSSRVDVDLTTKTMESWFYPSNGGWHNSPFLRRHDGSSFLFPNLGVSLVFENTVVRLGGEVEYKPTTPPTGNAVTDSVQACVASGTSPQPWVDLPKLTAKRKYCNSVLLPDGSVLVVGGTSNFYSLTDDPAPVMNAELYVHGSPQGWYAQPNMSSSRIYHSTALLLPSGKVLTAGGEHGWLWLPQPGGRSFDFQTFVPPYLSQGANRPTILSAPSQISFLNPNSPQKYKVYYSYPWDDFNVTKVVLMAPGSLTHHSDSSQRYVECVVAGMGSDATGQFIEFYAPLKIGDAFPIGSHAPPGYYMLFILTDNKGETWGGVPSEAAWTQLK